MNDITTTIDHHIAAIEARQALDGVNLGILRQARDIIQGMATELPPAAVAAPTAKAGPTIVQERGGRKRGPDEKTHEFHDGGDPYPATMAALRKLGGWNTARAVMEAMNADGNGRLVNTVYQRLQRLVEQGLVTRRDSAAGVFQFHAK